MKGLLRPLFVGGLCVAIAGTTLLGTSSVAFAAGTKPTITALSVPTSVNEGDKPTVTGTFTDPDAADQHTIQIGWGDGSMDFYTLAIGDRSFSVQKSVGYPNVGANMSMQFTLSDGSFSVNRFPVITVSNVAPSITAFSLSSTDLDAGSAVTATGGFDDPGTGETHTVTVNWGDGSTNTTLNLARRVWAFMTAAHTFTAGGTFTVTATVADSAGGSAVATSIVTVHGANQPPSVVSFGVAAGSEGGSSDLALTFADADAADTHTVSVSWGDGSTSGPVSLASTATTFSTAHVYADTGTYQVGLTLDDNGGHSVTAAASVSPTNVAPTVGALTLSPASVVDHQTLTLSGDFTDPGTADTFTLTIAWGDGKSSTQSLAAGTRSFSATHAYDADGPVTVTATVADRDNGAGSSSTSFVVLPSNHAPADLALSATAVLEGGSATLTVSFSDAEALDTHTVAINWGDGSTDSVSLAAGATTTSQTHTYAETGTYAVAVTVTDDRGLSVSSGTTVAAGNVAPSVTSLALSPSTVTDGQAVTLNGSFTDPGTADTFNVSLDWGDGSAASTQSVAAGTRTFTASHTYTAAGTYTVTPTVSDRDGGSGSQTSSLVVGQSNRTPSGLSLSPTVNGSTVVVSAGFADPDVLDTHEVTMSWGDGRTTMSLPAGTTSFTASHAYSATGTFTVAATVTDPSGASANASVQVTLTAPSGGSASELLDEMSTLIQSFNLDRNTERWILHRIDDLRASLSQGNTQVCADLKTLSKISGYATRTLGTDQFAALSALASQLETAAGCSSSFRMAGHFQAKKPVLAPVKQVAKPSDDDRDTSEKSDKTAKSDKPANPERPAAPTSPTVTDRKDKQEKADRKATKQSGDRD
ncbi:MAG: PKD domain-containing protein [Chloroflexota bacterium]|nr:PKD domain-containing protein [Chloroflexota bacterium]